MTEAIMKSIEYTDQIQEANYLINAFIVSAPEGTELTNIDMEEYSGYIFKISLQTEPRLPINIMNNQEGVLLLLGSNENIQIGYIIDNAFVEMKKVSSGRF